MEPVRVKLYGLISLTRRRYLAQVAAACVLGVVLLVAWWLRWPALRQHIEQTPTPVAGNIVAVLDNLPWILLAAAAVQGVEAALVLRQFARKQASAQQPVSQP